MRTPPTFPRAVVAAVVVALVGLVLIALTLGGDESPAAVPPSPSLRADPDVTPFQGLGVWVSLYDRRAWADPAAAVADMASHHVRTLYLQTSNFSRNEAVVHRSAVGAFLDAAASSGVRVVAWYLPGFRDLALDRSRSYSAMRFASSAGNRFDGFGLDIESPAVRDVALRTRRLLRLTAELRNEAGDGYPLGAIVPSPRGMVRNRSYWPGFPFAQLGAVYDAFLPMTYFTFRTADEAGARAYATACVTLLRAWVGSDRVPIHVIGGLAQDASAAQTQGFVAAMRTAGVLGASYYSWPGITADQWSALAAVPSNPVPSA